MTRCPVCRKERPIYILFKERVSVGGGDRCWGCALETKTFQEWIITGKSFNWFVSFVEKDLKNIMEIPTR